MTGYKAYQGNQVDGAGPLGLILLTYDALYKSLGRARWAIDSGDLSQEGEHTARALEALIELSTSLNMEEGADVAKDLASLYAYMMNVLTEKMFSGSVKSIDEVMTLTLTLQSGWKELSSRNTRSASQPIRSQSPSMQRPAMAYGGM